MEIGECNILFSVVDQFFQKITPDFLETRLIWVGAGLGIGLELVSRVVFWAFFEISLLITGTTRGPQQFPRFLRYILDNSSDV